MTWWALTVTPDPALRPLVAAWLVAQTGQAVEERDDGRVVATVEERGEADACLERLAATFGPMPATADPVAEVDWGTAWRDGLAPRRFGRLVVAPTWVEAAPGPGDVVVRLDPEMAFGSGEHGSTRVALTLLERHLAPGDRVLDLGTGSGILAIAAHRLGAGRAVGIEVDPEALPVAARNAARNAAEVHLLQGDAAVLAPLLGPADVVIANILRLINEALLPEVHAVLRPGGLAIFSGMEASEAELFRPALERHGLTIVDETEDAGWWGVVARRA